MYAAEVNYRTGHEVELIRTMITRHAGFITTNGSWITEARFDNEDARDMFEVELAAYNDQQDFLDYWQYADLLEKNLDTSDWGTYPVDVHIAPDYDHPWNDQTTDFGPYAN